MKLVAYYRVSTAKQGESGLGLEAQRNAVRSYARGEDVIAEEFTEVESGKLDERPVLAQAIAKAKEVDGTLVIAKLDRLSRKASFIFSLRDSGVRFVACDMPEANSLTIGIMAVMAEHERELISKRTKEGLAAKKRRKVESIAAALAAVGVHDEGKVLEAYREERRRIAVECGLVDNVLPKARQASIASKRAKAAGCEAWTRAENFAKSLKGEGLSLRAIAEKLNTSAFTTREGRPFQATTVRRLLARG